ncbi:MAG: glycosyltransferase family 39 protein [Rhodospirillales bacterium]|nr:glycosyltransferase family 39 protein [Rhodospirillales bacterium]
MTELAVLLLQCVSCIGYGAVLLRLLKVDGELQWTQRLSWSFVLGIGVLGWLLFFVGVSNLFSTVPMLVVLVIGALGLFLLGRPVGQSYITLTMLEKLLLAALFGALTLDSLEGMSPPADADTLAYHFATPKLFLEAGRIFFIPRAVDGAVPMLLQMTYASALGLGGEIAMTLWTMVAGWGTALLLYVIARSHMSRAWALTITLIWLSAPVVLYGGGSGQVEIRNAGFVLLGVAALMRVRETGLVRYAAIAGMAAGLFVASKYTGLLFGAAAIPALLTVRRWPLQVVVFGFMALVAGFQWYLWNFLHTGDPVFPMLFPMIGDALYPYWDAAHHQALQNDLFLGERAVPDTLLWMLAYPFLATFSIFAKFDSERAGMGPFLFLIVPFVVAGFWRFRREIKSGPWLVAVSILSVFYVLWFLSGSSQRVRHLSPLFPVALLICAYLATRWSASSGAKWPLALAALLSIGIQLAGHGASSLNYARHVFTDESRDAFYERNVSGYEAVKWINDNLTDQDKVLFIDRQLNYLIDKPLYYAHPSNETFADIRPDAENPGRYYHQLQDLGVTHILTHVLTNTLNTGAATQNVQGNGQWRSILAAGCAQEAGRVAYRSIRSRSLNATAPITGQQLILRLDSGACVLEGQSR